MIVKEYIEFLENYDPKLKVIISGNGNDYDEFDFEICGNNLIIQLDDLNPIEYELYGMDRAADNDEFGQRRYNFPM